MSTLYLHIGTPKTGTSAIQSALYSNMEFLEEQSIIYPDLGFRYDGVSDGRNGHFLISKDNLEGNAYDLAMQRIAELSKKYQKIVLSEENLWRTTECLEQFAKDLKLQGIQMKILVYFRRQDLYLQSQYAQHVKIYMRKTFEEYAETQKLQLDYYHYIQFFVNLVGKENLIVRVYERQQFLNQDLLSDFCAQVGIRGREHLVEEEKNPNESLGGIYLETKRLLNRNAGFQSKGNFVVPYLWEAAANAGKRASFSKNQYFSYEKQMAFLAEFTESNQKIAREFLGREDGVLFRDEILVQEKKAIKSRKYKLIKFLTEKLDMEKWVRQYVKDLDKDKSSLQYTKAQCVDVCGEVILRQQEKIKELEGIIEEMSPGYFENK